MKKALIIAYNDLNNSGVPNVIYQTIRALHNEYSFDVLVFKDDEYYFRKLLNEGIKVRLIKCLDNKPKGKIRRFFWWFHKMPKQHYLFMKRLLNDNHYSVVHSFKEYYSWPFLKAAQEVGIKKRIFHRNINQERPHRLIYSILESKNRRLSLKYSTCLVAVSEACSKRAFAGKRYTVLYNSYDEQKYNMTVGNELLNEELAITQVASYSANKNQLFSLQVLKELKKLHSNTKCYLVGANKMSPYYQCLIEYVKTNGLENDVTFVERIENVEQIYKKTTFAIVPSLREGFSLVTIEAQACGITVFASTNVTQETNCGGVNFLNLSSGPFFWAKSIFDLFIKSKNNRIRCDVSKFSFDRFKKQIEKLYE